MPTAQRRQDEGFYFVVVDGVPSHCQWQELKDYLRESVKVNPGYANVLKVNEDGTRVGFCPLRSKDDANKAFEFLVAEGWGGLDIRVSIVWKPDRNSDQIERRRGPEQSHRRRLNNTNSAVAPLQITSSTLHSAGYSALNKFDMTSSTQKLAATHYVTDGRPSLSYPPHYKSDPSDMYSAPPQQRVMSFQPIMPASQSSSWTAGTSKSSNRPAHSSKREERFWTSRQCIHISRLPYDTKSQDLKNLLLQFGQLLDLTMKRGKEKRCSATAKYSNPTDAALAIQQLNGKALKNMTLVVRLDRSEASSTSSSPSTPSRGSDDSDSSASRKSAKPNQRQPHKRGPLIVNGARGPSYNKRRDRDDDSESAIDTSESEGDGKKRKTCKHCDSMGVCTT